MKPTKDDMIYNLDDSEVKLFQIMFNKKMSEKFDWFIGSEFQGISFKKFSANPSRNFISSVAEIFVDEKWGRQQVDSIFGESEGLTGFGLGDIIETDLSLKIQTIMFKIFAQVTGQTPKYTSFSWMEVIFVDKPKKDKLEESIKRILKEETYDLGERTPLEKLVAKFVTNRLKDIIKPDNFYDTVVDIYDGEYGKYCHITYLMKKPFSTDDSDLISRKFKQTSIRRQIENLTGVKFNGTFSSSVSTIENYLNTKWWYDEQK